ncbi:MAG: outer membrane beta-barrel protein [Fimbriimonas sp.]
MKHLKNLTLITAAFGLAGAAAAQSTTQIDRPWKVELGVYFPNTGYSGADDNVGGTLAIGYSFLRFRDTYDLEIELRGKAFDLDTNFGTADARANEILLNGYYRSAANPFFFGLGVGFGTNEIEIGNVTFNDDKAYFVYNLAAGYRFQPNVYGVVRLHGGSEEAFRGFSVGAGYRF